MTRDLLRVLGMLAVAGLLVSGPATATTARPRTRPATNAKSKPRPVTTPATKPAAPRTLDAVHIEGQLDVPEVLFITARDQRRVVDFQHQRYLPNSRELAKRTPLPTRIVIREADTTAAPPGPGSAR
jgi:hypothetical protein